ncbi:MAG: transglycosylase domain-containing protein [Bacteroidales bacterium]|nr:transglycosylase domain-containing protein [Candidatus Cryptobacteroides caccocaballi]
MKETTQKRIIKWFWALLLLPIAAVIILLMMVWAFADIPSFEELEHPDSKLATQVIAEGGEILTTFHIENRSYVTYAELSPYLVQATVATEDARFYNHSGIDFKSLGRVLVKTLLMSDSSQGGGSTVTQQLAKTLYPRADVRSRIPGMSKVKMVWIKLKEWITAVKLERNYTKDEIMTMYLNSIFFGSGAYGVKAAAQTFFAKNPSELNVEESAMLVGMVNKPTRYNPALNPDKALVRRNFVISQMEKADFLTKAQRDSIQNVPISLSYQVQDHNSGYAPYFRDMLRRYMRAEKPKKSQYTYPEEYSADSLKWEKDALYGWLNKNKKADGSSYDLDRDGLRIYTTINYKMQKYAEEAVAEHLGKSLQKSFWRDLRSKRNAPFSNDIDQETIERIMKNARRYSDRYRNMKNSGASDSEIYKSFSEPVNMRVFSWNKKGYCDTLMTPDDSIRYYKSHLRAAFMAIEPQTGHVKAYVGGPNYRYFKFDNISQSRRQVGSTIKPFLYTTGLMSGMTPETEFMNNSVSFAFPDGQVWTPKTTDKEEYKGRPLTMRKGLQISSNNIAASIMKALCAGDPWFTSGPNAMLSLMREMGISCHIDPVPSICVGSAEVSIYEMVAAYNTFPSGGLYCEPIFVTRIEDNMGNTLSEFTKSKRQPLNETVAYTMVQMMRGVVDGGTAGRLRSTYGLTGEIAGKTGTTNDNSDGWFIGYTPTLTAGVWAGAEDRQVHFESIALGGGSNAALPIWGLFMKKVIADGTLGVSSSDAFIRPSNMNMDAMGPGEGAGEVVDDVDESMFF